MLVESHEYKEWIAGVFDRTAELYGKNHGDFFNYFAKNLVQLAALPKSARVLDVATGRGALLKLALDAVGEQGKVIGVDLSPNMIEHTSKEFKNYPNARLMCSDAENLNFNDNEFDFLFCGFGIFFFPNPSQALKEFYRVLKPGGKLFISTWGEDDYCDAIFNKVCSTFTSNLKTLLHNFDDPAYIYEIFSKSGFIDIKTIPDQLNYRYPTFEDWFSSLWTHASRGKLEKLSPKQIPELKELLKVKFQPYLQPDGFHEIIHAYYTHAAKPFLNNGS